MNTHLSSTFSCCSCVVLKTDRRKLDTTEFRQAVSSAFLRPIPQAAGIYRTLVVACPVAAADQRRSRSRCKLAATLAAACFAVAWPHGSTQSSRTCAAWFRGLAASAHRSAGTGCHPWPVLRRLHARAADFNDPANLLNRCLANFAASELPTLSVLPATISTRSACLALNIGHPPPRRDRERERERATARPASYLLSVRLATAKDCAQQSATSSV